jgi:hypothetical protein
MTPSVVGGTQDQLRGVASRNDGAPSIAGLRVSASARPFKKGTGQMSEDWMNDPASWKVHRVGASPEEFDKRLRELVRAGLRPGALEREVKPQLHGGTVAERHYQNVSLVFNSEKIYALSGAIQRRWQQLGGTSWALPTSNETPAGPGGGRQVTFDLRKAGPGNSRRGAILCTNKTGAHEIAGAIYDKFLAAGGVEAVGYPVKKPWSVSEGGRYGVISKFSRAYVNDWESVIVLKGGEREAWHVQGDIYHLWQRLGGVNSASPLGYPLSDAFGSTDAVRQYFEAGTVDWRRGRGAQVEMPEWHIRFQGFHVPRGSRKWDGVGDQNLEFYFHCNAVPRVAPDTNLQFAKMPLQGAEYANMRVGRWRHDNVVVYHGRADSVLLILSGAERDLGDPHTYRAQIQETTKQAIRTGLSALGGMVAGPAGVAGAQLVSPIADILGDELGSAINGAIGTGDESLNPVGVPLNLATIRAHLASTPLVADARDADGNKAAPIHYHLEVPLSGHGYAVRLYFRLVRGAP